MLNVGQKVSELRRMTVGDLRREYAAVFGEQTRSYHKEFLVRRIAWRSQANAEGGLPDRARQRALDIANDADLRTRAPGAAQPSGGAEGVPAGRVVTKRVDVPAGRVVTKRVDVPVDARLPMPGALLTREYRGRTIRVRVLPNGFDHEGTVYRSLSGVAQAVTGAHWNGYLFFGIQTPKTQAAETP